MFDRDRGRANRRPSRRLQAEALESRQLLVATLAAVPDITVPQALGFQVPLDGGGTDRPQTFTVSSSNPSIRATVARGQFLTIGVTHASSGPGDPAFSGTLTFQLFEDLTPLTTSRIESLVSQGYYTAPTTNTTPADPSFVSLPTKNFHRVDTGFPGPNDFIVQGGSAHGNGRGSINEPGSAFQQPGFPFPDEFVPQLAFTGSGQLAMANAGDDTNDAQFFITTGSPRFLDFNHTIFGQLVDGQGVLTLMTQVSRDPVTDAPISPILFTSTTLSPISPDGVLHIDATAATAGQTATITVTAADPADNTTATRTFQVNVVPDTVNNRPFLGPIGNQVVGINRSATFQLTAVNPEPTDTLTFIVRGGIDANGQFTPVQNATAGVDANGLVTVNPNPAFSGSISLVVGVRDQVNRAAGADPNAVANFDTQQITLNVTNNARPTAQPIDATTPQNLPTTIRLAGTDPNAGQTLTFEMLDQPGNGTIANFDAQAGTLTYTPRPNFLGTDRFTYRVRDVGEPGPSLTSEPATVTVTVTPGVLVNLPPMALPSDVAVTANTPLPVQLLANTGNPESPGQTLVYSIVTGPTNGTISAFDERQGVFLYTPATNFIGTDTLTFRVRDVGDPTPNLESAPATVTFTVTGAVATGAVRQIERVLVVTPLPRTDRGTNTIDVNFVAGQIAVRVNGAVDVIRPAPADLDRIVIYGAKANDRITVAPDVPVPVTLDGGHGGRNRLRANDIDARLHGWFGRNTLIGGAGDDALIGRRGHVRFVRSGGRDVLFAGEPGRRPLVQDGRIVPPTGRFFRFVGRRLVALPTPPPAILSQSTPHSRRRAAGLGEVRPRRDGMPTPVVGRPHPTPPTTPANPDSARRPRRT